MLFSDGIALGASRNTAKQTGAAKATVIQPVILTHNQGSSLNFGMFLPGTGGKVLVAADGTATVTQGVAFINGISQTSADSFSITADKQRNVFITTCSGSVVSGANTMPFTTGGSFAAASTGTTGRLTLTVGGKLLVQYNQPVGVYRGTYTVTAHYQ